MSLLAFSLTRLLRATGTGSFSTTCSTFDAINNTLYLAENVADSAGSTACATTGSAASTWTAAFLAAEKFSESTLFATEGLTETAAFSA